MVYATIMDCPAVVVLRFGSVLLRSLPTRSGSWVFSGLLLCVLIGVPYYSYAAVSRAKSARERQRKWEGQRAAVAAMKAERLR